MLLVSYMSDYPRKSLPPTLSFRVLPCTIHPRECLQIFNTITVVLYIHTTPSKVNTFFFLLNMADEKPLHKYIILFVGQQLII